MINKEKTDHLMFIYGWGLGNSDANSAQVLTVLKCLKFKHFYRKREYMCVCREIIYSSKYI